MEGNVRIFISIPFKLLSDIEQNVKGKDRNAKILKCLEAGLLSIKPSQQQ